MKKANKILSIILAILMVISIIPITASAASEGKAGDSIYWSIKNGVLYFSGSGEMYSYTSSNAPWRYYKDSIKEISLNDRITTIGEYAFYNLNITKVEIPEGIRKIGTCAFANCTSLSEVVIRKGVEIIDIDAFANCTSLNNVYYYSPQNDWGLINIRTGNNYLLNAELIVNGDGQITWEFDTETGTLTFNGSGEIPDYYNDDEDYYIKQPWDEIEKNIKHLVINEGITVIGSHAFANCSSLESVAMSSVTTIDDGAFSYAESLESITMSNSIQIIENSAFHECVKLIYIYYLGTQEEWNNVSIGENLNDEFFSAKVYTSDYYVSSDSGTYSGFSSEQTVSWELDGNTCTLTILGEGYIPDEVAPAIGSNMYKYAGYIRTWEPYKSDIKRIVITEGITRIGKNVFRFFPNLTEVVIPTSVTEISNSAFRTCDSITDVYYSGTEVQWNNIVIGDSNDALLNATIHYNYTPPFTGIKYNHFYKDDVMQKAYQLVEVDGDFYYIGDRHEIVKDKKVYIKAERTNDLTFADGTPITAGWYEFDENGKMVIVNGIVGNKIYKNNTQLKAYQLVEVDGEFYYIGDRHEIVKDKKVYIKAERTNGLTFADGSPITADYYEFDEDGKMVILNGVVGNKIYKNNTMLKAYQLVEFDGNYYYIGDRHEIVKDKKVYIKAERTNGLTYADGTPITAGWYTFDADGKLVIE